MVWISGQSSEQVAAIDARTGKAWTYGDLRADVAQVQALLPRLGRKPLGLLMAQNRYECIAGYLAGLNAGAALIVLDAALNPTLLNDFLARYRPDWILSGQTLEARGYHPAAPGLLVSDCPEDLEIFPELALLLNTSGSTGSPKLVRLTLANLDANASSIARYLGLTPEERPITSLPMAYSYGLSVLNSHLRTGASLILTDDGVLRREFWDAVDRHGCTSFAGVPYSYQMLLQAGLLERRGRSLKVLTQAGGRLDERHVRQMHELAAARGKRFFVMYGQTEATARISYLPWDQLHRKVGSVGIAIPDGSLEVDAQTGELIYSGPNVMLGYAEGREDLAKGDELHGVLRTGDLARQDEDGYFYITGRLKRFLKLFGKRFNLDDIESILSRRWNATVACYGHDDLLMVAAAGGPEPDALTATVCEMFHLPRTAVRAFAVAELPRTSNGKLDYRRLGDAEGAPSLAAAQ